MRPRYVPRTGITQGEQKVHGGTLDSGKVVVYLTNTAEKVFPMLLDAIFKRPKSAPPAKPLPASSCPRAMSASWR